MLLDQLETQHDLRVIVSLDLSWSTPYWKITSDTTQVAKKHSQYRCDVLMLCSKFELILTSIFQVTTILRKCQKSEKITVLYIAHGFFQKMALKLPQIFIAFSDTY